MGSGTDFYDAFAGSYHLLFEDWDATVRQQGAVLNAVIRDLAGPGPKRILDAACGIGTQAIGLALQGHAVTGSDLSGGALARARREAARFAVEIPFGEADMRALSRAHDGAFHIVCALDNAVAHFLDDEELTAAFGEMARLLAPGGLVLLSVRDYDEVLKSRPNGTPEQTMGEGTQRWRLRQDWTWIEEAIYDFRIVITFEESGETRAFSGRNRAVTRRQLDAALGAARLDKLRWMMPAESGYYQPLVAARWAQ